MIVLEFLEKRKASAGREFYLYAVLNGGGDTAGAEGIFRRAPGRAIFGMGAVDNDVPMYRIVCGPTVRERLEHAGGRRGIVQRVGRKEALPRGLPFLGSPLDQNGLGPR